jgi:vancomycin permeability regulator SanA
MEETKSIQEKKSHRIKRSTLLVLLAVLLLLIATPFALSAYVVSSARPYVLTQEQAANMDADCILVLGAGVWSGDRPSAMLQDRLDDGLSLYEARAADKLLMSGDHGRKNYDEVNVMKAYAVERGVPSSDVFMDHAGFSTYESMYRARDIFEAKRVIIVTQGYHLYRAIYDARALGLEAYGVAVEDRGYAGQRYYDAREILARAKDFCYALLQPKPTYLGEAIPVSGNGDLTNDKT